MPPPRRLRPAAAALVVFAALLLAIAILDGVGPSLEDDGHRGEDDGGGARGSRMLMNWLDAFSSPPKVAEDDYNGYPYSVIIVSYHKTGHDLQMDLIDTLAAEFAPEGGPKLTEHGNKSPIRRRRHPPVTPCARIALKTGTVSVQHAPDLFCTPDELAHILLDGGKEHLDSERGVKVVHLIRDPYSMAVSNYHYHARVPTPEPWVHYQDPCDIEYHEKKIRENYAEMIIPALHKMQYQSLGVSFGDKLFTQEDFDGILRDCKSLYQTTERLKNADLLKHLVNYDPPEGLRLATAEMMIQGHDNGGDILRMANNIVKLKQAQVKVQTSLEYQLERDGPRELQVYTMSLDDFIENPAVSALKFFDFVLDGTGVTTEHKERVAKEYEQYYLQKMGESKHVTHGKSTDSVQLKEYLMHNEVFGPPLSRIALLVETALADSRNV